MEWFIDNWIEIFAAVTGILYVFFEIRQHPAMWIIGFLSSAVYVYVFFMSKFYADASLYVYYVVISVYGWIAWTGRKKLSELNSMKPKPKSLRIARTRNISSEDLIICITTSAILFVAIGYILDNLTDSPVPYFDAFSTSLSIVATWMLTRKYIEHWYFWIIINIYCVPLYIWRGLYPTAVLFLIYAIMSFVGLKQWKILLKAEKEEEEARLKAKRKDLF